MRLDEKRSGRLNSLAKIWLKTRDENMVRTKAMLMGVSLQTANNYVETIKARYPNVNSNG